MIGCESSTFGDGTVDVDTLRDGIAGEVTLGEGAALKLVALVNMSKRA